MKKKICSTHIDLSYRTNGVLEKLVFRDLWIALDSSLPDKSPKPNLYKTRHSKQTKLMNQLYN